MRRVVGDDRGFRFCIIFFELVNFLFFHVERAADEIDL